jgi:hypothetical protein
MEEEEEEEEQEQEEEESDIQRQINTVEKEKRSLVS